LEGSRVVLESSVVGTGEGEGQPRVKIVVEGLEVRMLAVGARVGSVSPI
jgi:hypothetical protein